MKQKLRGDLIRSLAGSRVNTGYVCVHRTITVQKVICSGLSAGYLLTIRGLFAADYRPRSIRTVLDPYGARSVRCSIRTVL